MGIKNSQLNQEKLLPILLNGNELLIVVGDIVGLGIDGIASGTIAHWNSLISSWNVTMFDEAEAEHNGVHGVLGNITTKIPNSSKKRSHEQTSPSK